MLETCKSVEMSPDALSRPGPRFLRVVVGPVDEGVDAAVQHGCQVEDILHKTWYLHQRD